MPGQLAQGPGKGGSSASPTGDLSSAVGEEAVSPPASRVLLRLAIAVAPAPAGGDAPISVQTMTNTPTSDVAATIAQVQACAAAAHAHDRKLWVGTSPLRVGLIPNLPAGYPATPALRLYHDWEAWHAAAAVDGIVAIQSRLRIRPPCDLDPQASVLRVNHISRAVPECPLSIFQCVAAFCNRTKKSWDWSNFVSETPAMLEDKLRIARRDDADSVLFQELYIHLFVDTQGKEIGIRQQRQEYWDAVARWTRA